MWKIGFKIEIEKNIKKSDFNKIKKAYGESGLIQAADFEKGMRVVPKQVKDMIIVDTAPNKYDDITLFSILAPIKKKYELKRLVKIINVLGNDRVIKERISTFTRKQSMLNNLPELECLLDAMLRLDNFIPGIVNLGYYYSPVAEL